MNELSGLQHLVTAARRHAPQGFWMIFSLRLRTVLLRATIGLLVVLAVLAAIALFIEATTFVATAEGASLRARALRLGGLIALNLVFSAVMAILIVLFLWVRAARGMPDLQGWHLQCPKSEFHASDAWEGDYALDDYLQQEARVFEELDALIEGPWASQLPGRFSRFVADSPCHPCNAAERNWNRSQILEAENPVGGVLLLHGLSDAPYSLRTLGHRLHAAGLTVVWLRLPGHGTNPRALAEVSWQDWTTLVRLAVKDLRRRLPKGKPLVLAGYSNGGGLSVEYALSAIEDEALPKVSAVLLLSPMIGINPMAKLTRLYHTVGLVSRSQKAQWQIINAEIDPFKYNSWPMNGNVQAWNVTQAIERKLRRLAKRKRLDALPPILAMQSVVDSTVAVPKLITALFDRLPSNKSELFLVDVNRVDWLSNLLDLSFEKSILSRLQRSDRHYCLRVLRNADSNSRQLVLWTRNEGEVSSQATELEWPDEVVSLSHVALPFPPDDPVYGSGQPARNALSLGALRIRAEPSALMISDTLFARCRNNPFYQYMENHALQWLSCRLSGFMGQELVASQTKEQGASE